MYTHKPSEHGQALVIIALAIIALVAMTGLAIDGGNVYSDRRNAQNAADAAALAAGLARVREDPAGTTLEGSAAEAAGIARAATNGYANDGVNSVTVTYPISGQYIGDHAYIQVIIVSQVRTYFARVLGIDHMTNNVNAVVRVEPFPDSPLLDGNAILTMNEHDCPATEISGNANVELIGGGVFVNSDCENNTNKNAFEFNGNSGLIAPSLCTVGPNEVVNNGTTIQIGSIQSGCDQADRTTAFIEPNITCPEDAYVDAVESTKLHPGNVTRNNFPPQGTFPPAGITFLYPGVYCIKDGDFDFPNGTLDGSDVIIVVETGEIRINGGQVNLDGPNEPPYENLLLYMPSTNSNPITINGNNTMQFTGTVLAPSSHAELNGTSDSTGTFSSQIIVDTIVVSGGGEGFITYNGNDSWDPAFPPQVEFIE